SDITVNENSPPIVVELSGITSGESNEEQTLSVTAVSSNPSLIPNPVVDYASPNTTGRLTLAPATGASGTATIQVVVSDGQAQNSTVTRWIVVTVTPPNHPPEV